LIIELQKEESAKERINFVPASRGPGTELEALVPEFFKSAGCGCASYARRMDGWGVEGCEQRHAEIVEYLTQQANTFVRKKGLPLPKAVTDLVSRDIAEKWVTKAISTARDNSSHGRCDATTVGDLFSVVWVYWAGGAEGEELRYSIRSADKFLPDAGEMCVCGDVPEWFLGHDIHSPRLHKWEAKQRFGSGRFSKWIDSVIKLQRIIDDSSVTDRFLWMYDDTFFLRPVSINWISQPKATGDLYAEDVEKAARRAWREVRRRSKVALQERGLPTRDYSHHFPIVYDKDKLQRTIDTFGCHEKARVIESLYMNHHHSDPEPLGAYFHYIKRMHTMWAPRGEIAVLNVGGFRPPAERLMREKCPEACKYERN
jgi:hypothetical protein